MRFMLTWLLLSAAVAGSAASHRNGAWRWKIVTDPYRNYIYPGQTGLKFNISYGYLTESKEIRRFLRKNFDVKASESIARIYRDVSTGTYFERYMDVKVKFLRTEDTLFVKVRYENGEEAVQKYTGLKGQTSFRLHLTRYKNQHDFAEGKTKKENQRGLVGTIDVFVKRRHPGKNHVMVLSKIYTEAFLPGVVGSVNGHRIR